MPLQIATSCKWEPRFRFPKPWSISLLLIPLITILAPAPTQAQNTTWWYTWEQPALCYYQPDVYAFLTKGGKAYTGTYDPNIILSITHRPDRKDRSNEVIFRQGTTTAQRLAERTKIRRHQSFAWDYPVITHDSTHTYQDDTWIITDDNLMVNFHGKPEPATIDAFLKRHNLQRYIDPPANLPGPATYIFKIDHAAPTDYCLCYQGTTIRTSDSTQLQLLSQGAWLGHCDKEQDPYTLNPLRIARQIIGDEPNLVDEANPNFANLRIPGAERAVNTGIVGQPEDFDPDSADCNGPVNTYWHIHNDGTNMWGGGFGTPPAGVTDIPIAGADANICPCWNAGLTGKGTTIAVVASGYYHLTHTDMANLQAGYDCSNGPCQFPMSSNAYSGLQTGGQDIQNGFYIAGVAAAARYGIANQAKLIPVKTGAASMDYVNGLQELRKYNFLGSSLEGIAIDYFSYLQSSILSDAICWHRNLGRQNNDKSWGTPVIAPVGGSFNGNGQGATVYPAADPCVIGVIHSTPNDSLKALRDGWDPIGFDPFGSNFGNQYSIAAPGNFLHGPSADSILSLNGTVRQPFPLNGSLGTTLGVIALLQEANPNQYTDTLKKRLETAANRLAGNYSYTNGISIEFSHGRIDCGATLSILVANESKHQPARFSVNNPIENTLSITKIYNQDFSNLKLELRDMLGKPVLPEIPIKWISNRKTVDVSTLPPGIYLLSISNETGESIFQKKLLKF